MFNALLRPIRLLNREKYLPFIYPLVMPILNFLALKVPVYTYKDLGVYLLSVTCFQVALIIVIQKILYTTTYKEPVKWLIAFVLGCITLFIFLFTELNFFHFIAPINPNKVLFSMRTALSIPLLIALIASIKSAAERKRLVIDNKMLENENAQAQLNLLLQQINPHFLFNCLTVLQAMARSKDERTDAFIEKLGDVYRQTLKTDKGTVTLKEELDFFNAYMYLMGLRQEKAIFVDVQVSDEALTHRLPVFSLQLLAENCIKHNIVSASKPLTIRLYQKNPKSLTLENNLQPKFVKNESFGIGIKNLKKRYVLEGIANGMQIEKSETMYSTTIKLF